MEVDFHEYHHDIGKKTNQIEIARNSENHVSVKLLLVHPHYFNSFWKYSGEPSGIRNKEFGQEHCRRN